MGCKLIVKNGDAGDAKFLQINVRAIWLSAEQFARATVSNARADCGRPYSWRELQVARFD